MITEHFKLEEFYCPDCKTVGSLDNINKLAVKLETLRAVWNKPMVIISGYRCKKMNEKCGGAKHSQHMLSNAADIRIEGITTEEVAKAADLLGFDGIGIYPTFTHVDLRGYKARWRG
jgi:uncharacterized protein YcbK (DUF882 family)